MHHEMKVGIVIVSCCSLITTPSTLPILHYKRYAAGILIGCLANVVLGIQQLDTIFTFAIFSHKFPYFSIFFPHLLLFFPIFPHF